MTLIPQFLGKSERSGFWASPRGSKHRTVGGPLHDVSRDLFNSIRLIFNLRGPKVLDFLRVNCGIGHSPTIESNFSIGERHCCEYQAQAFHCGNKVAHIEFTHSHSHHLEAASHADAVSNMTKFGRSSCSNGIRENGMGDHPGVPDAEKPHFEPGAVAIVQNAASGGDCGDSAARAFGGTQNRGTRPRPLQ